MNFIFPRAICRDPEESSHSEWLETNGLGGYASATMGGINTRKYHGLLVLRPGRPAGRYVLLSSLEESLTADVPASSRALHDDNGTNHFVFSCRRHPGCFAPKGYEYLRESSVDIWPRFLFRMGDIQMTKEILMPRGRNCVLIRYTLLQARVPVKLTLEPLLAFRSIHSLTHENKALDGTVRLEKNGFSIEPYEGLPRMWAQMSSPCEFTESPSWYYNVEYPEERARGFEFSEDLYHPGALCVELKEKQSVIFSAATEELDPDGLESIWYTRGRRRAAFGNLESPETQLEYAGEKFLVRGADGKPAVIAGYPWFDSWGRDTMIALPGLTFATDSRERAEFGVELLAGAAEAMRDGLVPNMYSSGEGDANSYNSADSSLWFVLAAQRMARELTDGKELLKRYCWEAVKDVVAAYSSGRAPNVAFHDSMLHVGNENTQLTWMDAAVHGRPVTPRGGCPVEINALWYNAMRFVHEAALAFGEEPMFSAEQTEQVRKTMVSRFWSDEKGYCADVWRPASADWRFRPNQVFAASLPFPLLERYQARTMMAQVKRRLLTPFGLRTLDPANEDYCPHYRGGGDERDAAYHQGTQWAWLIGPYTDALLYSCYDRRSAAAEMLRTLEPMFAVHLGEYGVGSVAEVFDGAPPHAPGGTPFQAWSVAEVYRALKMLKKEAE